MKIPTRVVNAFAVIGLAASVAGFGSVVLADEVGHAPFPGPNDTCSNTKAFPAAESPYLERDADWKGNTLSYLWHQPKGVVFEARNMAAAAYHGSPARVYARDFPCQAGWEKSSGAFFLSVTDDRGVEVQLELDENQMIDLVTGLGLVQLGGMPNNRLIDTNPEGRWCSGTGSRS